ncbi:hypothetical protein BDZ91DRAFT_709338 [Kalaharituber pfeilii]|nr:hypothetical protein BDZ91DRAFT_709338 [Kalaharituber pfeilii]
MGSTFQWMRWKRSAEPAAAILPVSTISASKYLIFRRPNFYHLVQDPFSKYPSGPVHWSLLRYGLDSREDTKNKCILLKFTLPSSIQPRCSCSFLS